TDLALVETRLERLAQQQKGKPKGTVAGAAAEQEVLGRVRVHLENELPVSTMELSAQEREAVQHLAFLSTKPVVLVANIGEGDIGQEAASALQALREHGERSGAPVL